MIHFRIWQLRRQEQRDLLQEMHIWADGSAALQKVAFCCLELFRNTVDKSQKHTEYLAEEEDVSIWWC